MTAAEMPDYREALERDFARLAGLIDEKLQFVDWRGHRVPLFNQIEISLIDMCNRACVFCPRSDQDVAPNQKLAASLELCRRMTEEMLGLGFAGTVSLAGYGEPLMHRDIVEIVRIFSALPSVEIYTNGDLLKVDLIRALFEAGASRLIVNLYDSADQRQHFEPMFREAGIDPSRYALRDRWLPAEENFGMKVTNRAGTVAHESRGPTFSSHPCYYTHYYLCSDWNGDVYICPQDWNRRIKVGNLFISSMMETWTSSLLKRYRQHLAEGRRDLSPCSRCDAEGTLFGSNHMRAWAATYAG